jgi:uncharacterized HAD superfamily protein
MEILPEIEPMPIPYEIPKPRVYSIDLDNTLSIGTAWTSDEALSLEPREEVIEKVNNLYHTNFIVIHTARRHELYPATVRWLEKNGVRYHAIRMEKMPSDVIVDLDVVTKVEDL